MQALLRNEIYFNLDDENRSEWAPDKLAVFFTRKLNLDPKSPLSNRIHIAPLNAEIIFQRRLNWDGRYQPIKAQYEGLVSIETFNRANRGKVFIKNDPAGLQILYDYQPEKKTVTKTRNNPLFPYKNLVSCDSCH